MRIHFPHVQIRTKILRERNWGADISLSVTDIFAVHIDSVFPFDHPEIMAFLRSEAEIENHFAEEIAKGTISAEYAEKRRLLTPRLLRQRPEDLFSEVKVDSTGGLVIRDGHHRAGIARALGREFHNVVVALKVNFR